MGLRAPFDYVGYDVQFAEIMLKLLDDLCGGCHTNRDYDKGCHGCPAGQLIYACRNYLLEAHESDKNYLLYASEEWQAKRKELYGREDPPEERDQNRRMAVLVKPECDIIRAIKVAVALIEPHPLFHSQWIFEECRTADPLRQLREMVKDLDFIRRHAFDNWKFQDRLLTSSKAQIRRKFDKARLEIKSKDEAMTLPMAEKGDSDAPV